MSYRVIGKLAFGTVPRITIRTIASELPLFFENYSIIMTRKDSDPCVRFSDRWTEKYDLKKLGSAILAPESTVKTWVSDGWPFDSFEEIFLVPRSHKPTSVPSSDNQLTPNYYQLAEEDSPELTHIFETVGAERFLSDGWGIGLNYVCEIEIAELIEQLAT